jgi:ribosomal protein S18 acetylase RimI-like enzyme
MGLKTARVEDLPEVHALIERAYRGESARRGWTHEADLLGGQRIDPETLLEMVEDPNQFLLVHRVSGGIEACIALTRKGEALVYIGLVTVEPELQGSGIGRALLSSAEQFAAAELGATRAEMTVIAQRSELIAWYERRGYSLTGERRPFPHGDRSFGLPRRADLEFVVLEKQL